MHYYVPLEFNEIANLHEEKARFMKDNIAVVGLFSLEDASRNTSQQFVLGTTHLQWDPKLADVKLAQAEMLLRKIHEIFVSQEKGNFLCIFGVNCCIC
jgi:mRNA deadenylase 3'-5' endonuclease subunit Ccr4